MHRYVHTLGSIPAPIETKILNQHINYYLFSLIMGLRQTSFGYNTVKRTAKFIKKLKNELGHDKNLMIDSGGYSIIVGDVAYRDTVKCIECYQYYLDQYAQTDADYILSLDIPIFLNEPRGNTANNIYEWNRRSIKESKDCLNRNKDLYNKFIFVWHFKITKQFDIWRSIYDEFFRNKEETVVNHAIGGLVGLRSAANINFSPFLIPLYKVLKIISDNNFDTTSIVHILGVYHKYDRFILSFLSKLINEVYFKNRNTKIKLTFDTVNYTLTGLYKAREMPMIVTNNNDIMFDYAHNLIDYMDEIVHDDIARKEIIEDLYRVKSGHMLNNPKLLSLLMIPYNQYCDYIMTKMIEEENLLDLFLQTRGPNNFINQFIKIFNKWNTRYPFVFHGLKHSLCENFRWVKSAHELWEADIDEKKWDQCVKKFANVINFPHDLGGNFHYD